MAEAVWVVLAWASWTWTCATCVTDFMDFSRGLLAPTLSPFLTALVMGGFFVWLAWATAHVATGWVSWKGPPLAPIQHSLMSEFYEAPPYHQSVDPALVEDSDDVVRVPSSEQVYREGLIRRFARIVALVAVTMLGLMLAWLCQESL